MSNSAANLRETVSSDSSLDDDQRAKFLTLSKVDTAFLDIHVLAVRSRYAR